ncbi:major Facilitator Superfamily protein [Orientia chuto str. Dubai]|uniref:Major Facilitator Superfamily protein n=1 Tax=Orientia chuto str. Dubai TaxID=1359168 RepID=A0A0F3ML35_9RICK|nr:acyl-[ACP]--phospholipid O-acyltransferase [Candidatus Orientia mediorientalis]KJV56361.1 major Facilitator Superfamily protein [Orientia chuto str. Dubai]
MNDNKLYLFKDRRFMPLFITQFCGCLNDNILKSALVILIVYKLADANLLLIVNAIFILPFIILAGIAGQIADKFEKSCLISIIKISEIAIIVLAIYGFHINNFMILLAAIGLMGVHSVFFGPLKYSMLSDQLCKSELLGANGYVEAGTFFAILLGNILGAIYITSPIVVILLMVVVAVSGLVSSFFIPKSRNYDLSLKINYNVLYEVLSIIKYSCSKNNVFLSILGISWFWFIGTVFLSQIPLLAKDTLGADENVANLFLAVFSIGIAIGSFGCNKLLDNEITTEYVFIAAIGISIFGIDLFFTSKMLSTVNSEHNQLSSIMFFLSENHNWRILFDLLAISIIGGLYVVPLYTVMQYFTAPSYRSRVVAANNLITSIFMIVSTIILSILFKLECSIPFIILFISLLNLVVAGYIYQFLPSVKIIPFVILRAIFKFIFDKFYRVEIHGLQNFINAGKRVVIIANHISYLDSAILTVYLPGKLIFAVNTYVAQKFWVKPFLTIVKVYFVDTSNAIAIRSLISEVKKNRKIVIFPEGRISITGSLMKIYEGPGMIADKSKAAILPIRIDGLQYTVFSKLEKRPKTTIFPKVKITILPPVRIRPLPELDFSDRRKFISHKLYDIMTEMIFRSSDYNQTIFHSLIDASRRYGANKLILQDITNNSLTYRQCLVRSFLLGRLLSNVISPGNYIGVMLPNSTTTTITLFACMAYNFIPTMINFTLGIKSIISSCRTVGINIICTSRLFIEKARLQELNYQLNKYFRIIYLEDLRSNLKFTTKIVCWLAGFFPRAYYSFINKNNNGNSRAIVLFTAGTEQAPKAVVLSHNNLLANKNQVSAVTDLSTSDIAFNALPMFHTFGLTGTILMVLSGVRTFLYPSPLDYRIIPEVIYDVGATIMFSTSTFLNNYAKYAHPYDFYSLRRIYAGAEKLRPETRELWFKKHGIKIFEGYGATEASPVISANTPMHDKPDTVGRIMPGLKYAALEVEGISNGKKLCIKGPNVMLGYILSSNPGVIVPPKVDGLGDRWYDTGDIVSIDEEGYITIKGRARRFAKIAGEMVSLVVIEDIATAIDKNGKHAAVCVDDEYKGEQIILCTDSNIVDQAKFARYILNSGLSKLYIPRDIIHVVEIPYFTTGKTDYVSVSIMVKDLLSVSVNKLDKT